MQKEKGKEKQMSAAQFVRSLEMPEMKMVHRGRQFQKMPSLAAMTNESPEAFVNKGSLLSFVAGVSTQAQEDALNATLLAQLAADHLFDKEKQTERWYGVYTDTLARIGFPLERFQFNRAELSASSATFDRVILDILAAALTENEVAVLEASLDALKQLPEDDQRVVLWDQSTHSAEQGNFQIGIASDAGGVLTMKMGAFHFSATQEVTRLLFFTWETTSGELYQSMQQVNQSIAIYDQVRAQILEKLGSNAMTFIAELDITPRRV